jgi:IPT/TIG domain-containing protein/YXWGXW repeat-containing protein
MRRVEPWLLAVTVVTGIAAGATSSSAQPTRDHRTPPPPVEHDHRREAPPADYPRAAPPAPQDEHMGPRAGFVWAAGRWDWRGGKWEWLPGHWERERPGKRWNPGRWDRQGDRWVLVEGSWVDGAAPPSPSPSADDGRPHQPPPPPQDEHMGARAGFAWAHGRWDWRGGKWEWLPGHWERERPGKQWREARWEQRDGAFMLVDGEWVDASAVPPAPPGEPPGPPPDDRGDPEHHRPWKLDRPVVSSYWPVKGKIGSRIVIRGRNFPADTVVMWNGGQVTGAKVEPERVVVAVPPGTTSGTLSLRTGQHRELTVGNFEVANYDAEAEARRRADEERRQAEQAWAERQKQLAKDRAARLAAIEQHHRELDETRDQRRAEREREIRAKWEAAFLADPDTQAELTLHAQRTAELARMREVAELSGNGKLVVRIGVAQSHEDNRHPARMTALHDSFGRKP